MKKQYKTDIWDIICCIAMLISGLAITIGNIKVEGIFNILFSGFFLATQIFLWRGFYSLKKGFITNANLYRLIVGLLLFTLFVSIDLFAFNFINNISIKDKETDNLFIEKLSPILQNDTIPLARKAKISKLIAYKTFVSKGILIEYFDTLGNKHTYLPSNEDKTLRKTQNDSFQTIKKSKDTLIGSLFIWILLSFITIITSFSLSRFRKAA